MKRTHTLFFKSFQSSLFLSLLAAGKAAACQLPYTPPYILPVHVLLCHKLTIRTSCACKRGTALQKTPFRPRSVYTHLKTLSLYVGRAVWSQCSSCTFDSSLQMRPWLRFWQEDRGGLLVVFLWMDRAGRRLVKQALKLTRSSWNLGKGGVMTE